MNKPLVGVIVVVGLLLLVVGVIYFIEPANALPSFLPGHDASVTGKHTKHGIIAIVLAAIAFLAAWFASGPKAQTPAA